MVTFIKKSWCLFETAMKSLNPVVLLFLRCWLFYVFFFSALTKTSTWESTLFLFEYEYNVPILSPYLAAVLGTGIELIIPPLLLIGLGSRFPAFVLFVFNIVAVISYPFLWTAAGAEGWEDHFYWGVLLAVIMAQGHGKLSLDYLLCLFFRKRNQTN